MQNNRSRFSVDYTNMLKGVALLFLLCNHFCVVKDWITPPNELIDVYIHDKPLLGYVGAFGKICVAIWAFLSGVGAYYSYKNEMAIAYRSNLVRLANLLIQYMLILLLVFIPVIAVFNPEFGGEEYKLNVEHIVYNIFACDAEYDKAAWYMRFYIMYVLSFPLFMVIKKQIRNTSLFYAGIFLFFLFIPKAFCLIGDKLMIGTVPFKQALGEYCNYIIIVLEGYWVTEYRLFEKCQNRIGVKTNIVISIAFLILAMALRSFTKSVNISVVSIYTDILITPFVVYAFFVFFQNTTDKIRRCFIYIGKASMVVWLVHWIFNVGVPQIQAVAYFPRLSYLIILWVLIMCLGFNHVFSYFMKKSNFLFKIKK